jgi:hypothetical protein
MKSTVSALRLFRQQRFGNVWPHVAPFGRFSRSKMCLELGVAFLGLFPGLALAQGTDNGSGASWQAPRDNAAFSIVTASLAKMGGDQSVSALRDAAGSGTCSYVSPDGSGNVSNTEPFAWTISGTEFLYESGTGQGQTIVASGHGKPSRLEAGQMVSWSYSSAHAMRPYQIPALVLRAELNDVNFGMKALGQQTFLGSQVNVVQMAIYGRERALQGSAQQWYFSSATGLPIKVEYLQPSEQAPEVFAKITEVFSNFEPQAGILIPMSIQMQLSSAFQSTCTVAQFNINHGYPASKFDLISGGNQ